MKLIKNIPKNLINKYKRSLSRSVSRSEDPSNSFSSSGSSSSESSISSSSLSKLKSVKKKLKTDNGPPTPTTVLRPTLSSEIEWSEVTPEVFFEVEQAFKMIDSDGDGKITVEELEALLSRVGAAEPPSREELSLLLSEVDRDGDGCISLEEFGAISSAFGPPACDSELKDAFDFFDADHDGRITAEELYNVFRVIGGGRYTLEECRRMISGVDKNGDGFVCFEDFTRMMELQR